MINIPLAVPDAGVGNDDWWVVGLKVLLVFVFLIVLTLFNIWWERRVVARMQQRIGPNGITAKVRKAGIDTTTGART